MLKRQPLLNLMKARMLILMEKLKRESMLILKGKLVVILKTTQQDLVRLSSASGIATESALGSTRKRRHAETADHLNHVNIATEDIRTCSSNNGSTMDVHAKEGVIQYTQTKPDNGSQDTVECTITLTVCEKCIVRFTLLELLPTKESPWDFHVHVQDNNETDTLWVLFADSRIESKSVFSFSNAVTITISAKSEVATQFKMSFQGSFLLGQTSAGTELHFIVDRVQVGRIRRTTPPLIDSCVTLNASRQNVIMISFVSLDIEVSGSAAAAGREVGLFCSVWPDFRDHFACTVDTECAGGEDKITVRIPWNWAREICITRGADLASLNTQDEWQTVLSFLQGQEFDWVFVGLQLASPPLPDIYLDSWQWADETIAFYLTIKGSGKPPPYCAAFHVTNATRLSVVGCQARLSASVLCEMDTESDSPVQDVVTLPSLITNVASASDPEYLFPPTMNVSDSARLVSCPAGHLTRDFLACDVDSACWKLSLDSAAECEAPMTPLPPSFACKHGVGHVPYSSVCDFRPDCVDSSDELCVFPLCSAVSHFKCGNQQCIKKSEKCDGVKHCVNEADEKRCYIQKEFDVDMLAFTNLTFPDLKILHVAGIVTRELHVIVYTTFPNVQHLNLSHTRLERMPSE
ncbi:hypothetical protein BaRGS_00034020, partial [Batillaria attramentaria]